MKRAIKFIRGIAATVAVLMFFLTLGIVGGNEQGTISNGDMMLYAGLSELVLFASLFVLYKTDGTQYMTEEEYEELLRKEGRK